MTPKRTSTKDEPAAAERPRLNKETVKDLDPKRRGEGVKGGLRNTDRYCEDGGNATVAET